MYTTVGRERRHEKERILAQDNGFWFTFFMVYNIAFRATKSLLQCDPKYYTRLFTLLSFSRIVRSRPIRVSVPTNCHTLRATQSVIYTHCLFFVPFERLDDPLLHVDYENIIYLTKWLSEMYRHDY